MFELQVDELLARSHRERKRRTARIDASIQRVKSIIDGIPTQEAKPVRFRVAAWAGDHYRQ